MTVLEGIFQIHSSTIPDLVGYRPDFQSEDMAMLGGKLAFRLQMAFSGR